MDFDGGPAAADAAADAVVAGRRVRCILRAADRNTRRRMRVTCPECESKFKVPDKALGATGRKLRCSQCGHQWFQEPKAEKPAAKAASKPGAKGKPKPKAKAKPRPKPTPEVEEEFDGPSPDDGDGFANDDGASGDDLRPMAGDGEMDPPPLGGVSRFRGPRRTERPPRRLPVPLLVLAGAAIAIPAVLFAGRDALVEAWPASALLYDTTGLHVPVPGEGLVLQNVFVQRRQEGTVTLLVVAGEIHNPTDRLRSLPALRGTVLDGQGDAVQTWLFTAEEPQLLPGDTGRFQSELAAPAPDAVKVNVTFTADRPEGGIGY